MEEYGVKPPIGIEPETIWKTKRIRELARCIHDYSDYRIQPSMLAWTNELQRLLEDLLGC